MVTKRFFYTFLFFIAVLSLQAQPIDSILIRSVGGEKGLATLQSLQSLNQYGRIDMNGLAGKYRQIIEFPDKYYLSVEFPSFSMVQAYDGTNAWQKSMNGQISLLSENERQEIIKGLLLSSYGYIESTGDTLSKRYLGEKERDGKLFDVVEYIPFEGDTVMLYFDKINSLRNYVVSRHDVLTTVTKESDYRKINDLPFAFQVESDISTANFSMVMQADSLTINVPFETGLFTYPLASEKDYYFPIDKRSITLPLDYQNGHLRIQAGINGKKNVWMILDSGSATNILNMKAIEGLGIEQMGTLPGMGVGGIEEVALFQTDSITIGDLTLLDQVAGAIDLQRLSGREGSESEFGGILGYDFLSRFPVMIDYQNEELTVFNPDNLQLPNDGVHLPFNLTMQIPSVEAEINGVRGDFIVDLGNAFGLILLEQFVEQEMLQESFLNIQERSDLIGGIGGSVSGYRAVVSTFSLGSIDMNDIDVLVPAKSGGITASEDIAGNIGNQVLQDFTVLINYLKSEIILFPAND